MIREKEVVLTSAPGWQEAVGRPEVRGEDDIIGEGIREVVARFVPRTMIGVEEKMTKVETMKLDMMKVKEKYL